MSMHIIILYEWDYNGPYMFFPLTSYVLFFKGF